MARFRKFKPPKITTVIGRDTEVRGNLKFHGGLHVDGRIKGDISCTTDDLAALILSEFGTVEGNVRVSNVIINGTVIGDVYATERAELAPKARITGTLYYYLLEMAMGAEVNGQLVRMEEGETRMLSYDGSPAKAEKNDAQDELVDAAVETGESEAADRSRRGRIQ